MAGGGVKPGISYGATDEFGCSAVEKRVHVHDLHATILHCMGLDHEKLTYRYSGRDYRLTDVSGNVIRDTFGLIEADFLQLLTKKVDYRSNLDRAHENEMLLQRWIQA